MIGLPTLGQLEAVLPMELLNLTTWVPWTARPRPGGGIGKVPALPLSGQLRPVDGRSVRLSLEEAQAVAKRHSAPGLGVVLGAASGLCALDLDGPLGAAAEALLAQVPGYAELSPSGRGVHLWLAGSPARNCRRPGVELIGRGLVTVTGARLRGRPRALGDLQFTRPLLGDLNQEPPARAPEPARPFTAPALADADVLRRLLQARNGTRAQQLMNGEGSGYPSSSEADLALARMLRFYTRDLPQLERLMRHSNLCRPKWGREGAPGSYLTRTIRRALELGGPVYTSGSPR